MNNIKCAKRSILSVLLLSFVFLVFHDFAMPSMDSYKQESTFGVQKNASDALSKNEELSKEIHKSIHTLLAVDAQKIPQISKIIFHLQPSYTRLGVSSNNNCVLERPPLA